MGDLRLLLRTPGDNELVSGMTIRPADLDKPIRTGGKEDIKDETPPTPPAPKADKTELPILPKEEVKPEEVKPEVGPKPQPDEPKEEIKPLKRDDADRVVAAPPKPKSKRHTMTIIEGSSVRKQTFVLNGKKEDEEDDEEAEGGSDPAPARKDANPAPRPKIEQPKTNRRHGARDQRRPHEG